VLLCLSQNGATAHELQRLQNRSGGGEQAMLAAIREIGALCERMNLVGTVKERALEVFKEVRLPAYETY
jgi:transcription initiation factor TFIIB